MRGRGTHLFIGAVAAVTVLLASVASAAPARRADDAEARGDIVINSDGEFTADHGVRSGTGTRANPYVISGWNVPSLVIRNTSAWVTIRDNVVTGTMVLDWAGPGISLHHNQVGDLRVNQNVARTGLATSGTINNNKFGSVSQLRHWDGVFTQNVVGDKAALIRLPGAKAILIDGFNGSRITNNVFYGYVDMKLHGHHHSSGFGGHSHDHADMGDMPAGHEAMGPDHSRRYHEGWFTNNKIFSEHSWAFRYYDRAHTGDDRTAASETDLTLNCPHVHYTRLHVADNTFVGSGLWIDVFNAADDNHWSNARGLVEILNNDIGLARDVTDINEGRPGILVQEATNITLRIDGNEIVGSQITDDADGLGLENTLLARSAGIKLRTLDNADVAITHNSVYYRRYGVEASQMTSTVKWRVEGLYTQGAEKDVYYDDTVANKPRRKS